MQIAKIIDLVEAIAPAEYAAEWDNVGLQVGDPDGSASACLLAVDVTADIVAEANRRGCSLIICHHPVIFEPLSAVSSAQPQGAAIMAATRTGVAIYAAHTNLDASLEYGTAAALADRLGVNRGPAVIGTGTDAGDELVVVAVAGPVERVNTLLKTKSNTARPWQQWPVKIGDRTADEGESIVRREVIMSVADFETVKRRAADSDVAVSAVPRHQDDEEAGMGMVTSVPALPLRELAGYVKKKLAAANIQFVGDPQQQVETAALLPGSGGGLLEAAAKRADAAITGTIDHHEAHRGRELNIGVITAGHYDTERPVLDLLAEYIQQNTAQEFEVAISQQRTDPFHSYDGRQ